MRLASKVAVVALAGATIAVVTLTRPLPAHPPLRPPPATPVVVIVQVQP